MIIRTATSVAPVKIGDMRSEMTRVATINVEVRMNIETLVLRESYMT